MIIELPDTTTGAINKTLVRTRSESGVITLGRVMTLVIDTSACDSEKAISTANAASKEHPCRIVVLDPRSDDVPRLDAEIRVGGDAGASEVVILRAGGEMADHGDTLAIPLLLPDAPIVSWWPGAAPANPSHAGVGAMSARRITDSKADSNPVDALLRLADSYAPGDTDLAWARVTRWRALLAAALDELGSVTVVQARIHGDTHSPSILLLGAWLEDALGCEYTATYDDAAEGLISIALETADGEISIVRQDGHNAILTQPDSPDHVVTLPQRTLTDCLAEELRRLDPDEVYGETLASLAAGLRS